MTWLTVFVGIIAFSNLILLTGLAMLAISVKRLLDDSVKPVLTEVKSTITDVNTMVHRIDDKAEKIMTISEDTAQKVSDHIVSTSGLVSEVVNSPLINIAGAAAGIAKMIIEMKSKQSRSYTSDANTL